MISQIRETSGDNAFIGLKLYLPVKGLVMLFSPCRSVWRYGIELIAGNFCKTMLQETNDVLNLFFKSSHRINEYFGMHFLNQTRWCQWTSTYWGSNNSTADLIEKVPFLQANHLAESWMLTFKDCPDGRSCTKSSISAVLLLPVGIFQSPFSITEESLACSSLPNCLIISGP